MKNQLEILAESLDKKIQVLHEIQNYNLRQEECFQNGQADLNTFDQAVEEKERLIQKLNQLEEGFDTLYQGLAAQLKEDRNRYTEEIRILQEKIREVTELSMSVQAQESRNKKLIEDFFAKQRAGLNQSRKNSKAMYDYYKNVSKVQNYAPSSGYDFKS